VKSERYITECPICKVSMKVPEGLLFKICIWCGEIFRVQNREILNKNEKKARGLK